jgi:hypothetical protein
MAETAMKSNDLWGQLWLFGRLHRCIWQAQFLRARTEVMMAVWDTAVVVGAWQGRRRERERETDREKEKATFREANERAAGRNI